ncbi:MAG: M1 family metallopeptidase [Ruminococcaceae bacterium]|nr:M1 family metallopeptidase [Oscillospiraceae bacterium]
MTLSEGKRRVLMLLDEYSSGGTITVDEDIDAKMNDFFDIAQKDIAQWQPIIRRTEVTLDGTGEQALPADVSRVLRITRDGRRARDVRVSDGKLRYPAGDTDTLTLDYAAVPETITPQTEDAHAFEVSEEAASCLPFFVAAQQLIADLVVDYAAFYNIYLQMRGMLPRGGGAFDGGAGGVRQALYGR